MGTMIAPRKPLGLASRFRLAGTVVLLCGLSGASLMYWRAHSGANGRAIEELMPGYAQARARQRGILMGSFVAELMDDFEALRQPGTQAVILAIVTTIAGLGCFRLAAIVGQDERE